MTERSMRELNLAFRFVLEIVVLAALAMWGFGASNEPILAVVLGLGAPAIVIAIWATFVSPKAPRRLRDPTRLIVEIVVFAVGVLAFILAGQVGAGIVLALAAALSLGLMVFWGQRGR